MVTDFILAYGKCEPGLPLTRNNYQRPYEFVTDPCALFILRVGFRVGDGAEWKIRVTPCYRETVRGFSVYVSMIFYHFAAVF